VEPDARLLIDPEPITPADLGLASQKELEDRLSQYVELALSREGVTPEQVYRHALALVLGARIKTLEGNADKFRAEGELTTERDIMSRIRRLEGLRDAALQAAGLTGATTTRARGSSVSVPVESGY